MKFKTVALSSVIALSAAGGAGWLSLDKETRGFLAEFGVSRQPECQAVLAAVLKHVAANPEWLGWTVWASSARFGSYPFNLYPFQQPAPPQLDTIKPFLAR